MSEDMDDPIDREEQREQYEENAAKGVELLDTYGPANWRDLVRAGGKLDRHAMTRVSGSIGECGCVVGRIFGNYLSGLDTITESTTPRTWISGEDYGFSTGWDDHESWALLADVWNRILWPEEATP